MGIKTRQRGIHSHGWGAVGEVHALLSRLNRLSGAVGEVHALLSRLNPPSGAVGEVHALLSRLNRLSPLSRPPSQTS